MLFIGSTLKRQPLPPKPVSSEASLQDTDLAQEAETLLGYSGLSRAVAGFPSSVASRRFLVECTLAGLGIAPFSSASVERYKSRMLRKVNRGLKGLYFGILAASILVLVGLPLYPFAADSAPGGVAGVFLVSLLALGVGLTGFCFSDERPKYAWQTTGLRGYGLPVPKHALVTAIKVVPRPYRMRISWSISLLKKSGSKEWRTRFSWSVLGLMISTSKSGMNPLSTRRLRERKLPLHSVQSRLGGTFSY